MTTTGTGTIDTNFHSETITKLPSGIGNISKLLCSTRSKDVRVDEGIVEGGQVLIEGIDQFPGTMHERHVPVVRPGARKPEL